MDRSQSLSREASVRSVVTERQAEFEVVDPRADAVAESLRAVGYSLPNAVADIVDNSISAGATKVETTFWWDGPSSWIRVADNGCGMTQEELKEAMRLGNRSPLEPRDPRDLGRFGLGLKTASFSQCRRVSVHSKAEGSAASTRCWDLDFIQRNGKWALLWVRADAVAEGVLALPDGARTGTVVLWEVLDRVVTTSPTSDEIAHRSFLAALREVSGHLGMVFHRFLSGREAIALSVNGAPVVAWDPFLVNEPSTQALPVETFGTGHKTVTVRPFVLPHQSKIPEETFRSAAGPRGWNAQQGFYIYRNSRLIAPGGWLRMFQQEEHFKLARIQVDIGNALDEEWQIDVRKARARPPDDVARELRRVAEATRKRAVEVYRHRGRVLARQGAGATEVFVWEVDQRQGKRIYRVNREHPLIKRLIEGPAPGPREVRAALRLIEETLPIPYIIGTFSENAAQQGTPFEGAEGDLRAALSEAMGLLRDLGLRGADLKRALMAMEPFQHYPEVVEAAVLESRGGRR